jgi:hypothetical protein
MKKIVVVDVGTHFAQEYRALFEHSTVTHLYRIARRYFGTVLGRGSTMGIGQCRQILSASRLLRGSRSSFFYIFVEPNPRLFTLPVYRRSDLSLNVSLCDDAARVSFRRLYHGGNLKMGQGSSLYLEKGNVEDSCYDYVLNVDSQHFANQLKLMLDSEFSGDYLVILRINNEGAESDVIFAFENVFSESLKAVMGSLKDTALVKGDLELAELYRHMKDKDIEFIELSSSVLTWANPMTFLKSLISSY